ncbi:MAG: AMP-binding protein, partial [Gemmatimonadota bacterium]
QSGTKLLLLARHFRAANYVEMFDAVRPNCPQLGQSVVIDGEWDALLERGQEVSEDALAERERSLQFDDPINIQYTSGTTGFP